MNLCLWSQCSQARKKNARNRTYEPAIGEAIQVINGRGLKLPIPQLHPSQQRLLSPVYRSETYYCTVHTSLKMAFRRISCIFQTLWTLPSIPFPCRVDLQQSRERETWALAMSILLFGVIKASMNDAAIFSLFCLLKSVLLISSLVIQSIICIVLTWRLVLTRFQNCWNPYFWGSKWKYSMR